MDYKTVLFEIADNVATITLNRPEAYNSFTRDMTNEFVDIWNRVRDNDAVRVIVLRAAPSKAFCTGADVKGGPDITPYRLPEARLKPWQMDDPAESLGPKSNKVWKPVIVAVSGMCAGGGFYFLNEADIIICSDESTFFDPHVNFGMVSACEPVGAMARMPLAEVQRMVLLGNHERISAETALRISLVTEVLPNEKLWARAAELAAFVADKHPVAIEGSVRAIWESLNLPFREAMINALKYTQIGNPISTAAVDRGSTPKVKWKLR
ncbi:enoyl-CoA hydratase/isomerase family protein [Parasphingorhabdus sp.]|uniref:enoyl-CoA hydratase/isomerase family protein n=1 Tax=Parasphingorhabdus sp. TaxID=2709688 RepID=UPI003001068A